MNPLARSLFSLLLVLLTLPVRSAVVHYGERYHGLLGTNGPLASQGVVAVSAGAAHRLFLTALAEVFAEGAATRGQLGNGNSGEDQGVVAVKFDPLSGGRPFTAVAAGFDDSFALTADGRVFAWGLNHFGQLGTGDTNELIFYPQAVDTNGVLHGKKVIAIAAGLLHGLALTGDGRVFAWGHNDMGQLGDGTTNDSRVPVAVDRSGVLAGQTVKAIAAGASFSLALTTEGKLFGWGYNGEGALGDGTVSNRLAPVAVELPGLLSGEVVTAVSAGGDFSVVLTGFGRVFAWGSNDQGQLGDGTRDTRLQPGIVALGDVAAGRRILSLATGAGHCLALASDGTAFAWGDNQFVQLGLDGVNEDRLAPALVPATAPLSNVSITGVFSGSAAFGTLFVTAGPVRTTIRQVAVGAELSIVGEPATFYVLHRSGSLNPLIPVRGSALLFTDTTGHAVQTNADLSSPTFWRAVPVPVAGLYFMSPAIPPYPTDGNAVAGPADGASEQPVR